MEKLKEESEWYLPLVHDFYIVIIQAWVINDFVANFFFFSLCLNKILHENLLQGGICSSNYQNVIATFEEETSYFAVTHHQEAKASELSWVLKELCDPIVVHGEARYSYSDLLAATKLAYKIYVVLMKN